MAGTARSTQNPKIRVVVVDDHPLFRDGVARTLQVDDDIEIVGAGHSAEEAVQLAISELPDVAILDLNMPGGGFDAVHRIARQCPVVKIIMLTVSEDEENVTAALQAGARGYIAKGVSGTELIQAVKAVASGENYVSPGLAARLLSQINAATVNANPRYNNLPALSQREEAILALVSKGLTNKEIAQTLALSEKTVKHHVSNVIQKLQVRNRTEAALTLRQRYVI